MNYQEIVKEFHKQNKLPISEAPKTLGTLQQINRESLILEEFSEYVEAASNKDIRKIAKELTDLLYVVIGTFVEHGLPMDRLFEEIHRSNMTKKGGGLSMLGKLLKPKQYREPDLSWLTKGGET